MHRSVWTKIPWIPRDVCVIILSVLLQEQAVQLANYILTRKATQTIRNAYLVVAALKSFSGNTVSQRTQVTPVYRD